MMYCGDCRNWECRCDGCYALVEEVDWGWYCEDYGKSCKDVECCSAHEVHEDMECDRYRDEV